LIGGRSVLAIIPARGGSKGIKRKNLVDVGGRPLIVWTIAAALGSRHIDRVILSSDDEEIIAAAEAAGCEAPFRRPASLATDEAGSAEVVAHALARVPGYALFVLLQPTSPLRTSGDIDAALELLDASGADFCVSVTEAEDHPYLVYRRDEAGRIEPF
jgi:N-acylneuraminate cytidylyltransferase